jgi:FKBP-type peptidyl-prolyl cis-trans isomerase FkpA
MDENHHLCNPKDPNMRSISLLVFFFFLSFTISCKKEDTTETLDQYIKRMNLTGKVVQDPRGFYYNIISPGTGTNPSQSSKVTVLYTGALTSGTVFDQTGTNPATFNLNQLILGWQYGLPLIKAGGRIMLYLPPQLGYGSTAAGSIPANSNLIFDITLQSVQ